MYCFPETGICDILFLASNKGNILSEVSFKWYLIYFHSLICSIFTNSVSGAQSYVVIFVWPLYQESMKHFLHSERLHNMLLSYRNIISIIPVILNNSVNLTSLKVVPRLPCLLLALPVPFIFT
jgi:hypothetical protein